MNKVDFIEKDKGAFTIDQNGERVGEMVVGIEENKLSVYHTGVMERLREQGIGKQLVVAMADYARANGLKVMTYCPFVKAMFQQQEEQYADIWEKETRWK